MSRCTFVRGIRRAVKKPRNSITNWFLLTDYIVSTDDNHGEIWPSIKSEEQQDLSAKTIHEVDPGTKMKYLPYGVYFVRKLAILWAEIVDNSMAEKQEDSLITFELAHLSRASAVFNLRGVILWKMINQMDGAIESSFSVVTHTY